jgi:hypothetical protein
MSARGLAILGRFPTHVGATDPGKRLGVVAGALGDALDVLTRQVGDVRRSHRLGEAPSRADLLGLAGLHGLTVAATELLDVRLRALAAAARAADPTAIAPLVNLPAEALTALDADLAAVAGRPARHGPSLELQRGVVAGAVHAHLIGNATPTALLSAAAAYLGLAVEQVEHTEGRWWHVATCRDRVRLAAPAEPGPPPDLTPGPDVLALEENPFQAADLEPTQRRHGQRFRVLRGGLEDVDVTVRVRGVGSRTSRPMVVHVDAGAGLVYEGDVPDGEELAFTASGRVTLAGADVTGSAWSFQGAVLASVEELLPQSDFVFADADAPGVHGDREATFVVTAPLAGALDEGAPFPHGAPTVGPLRLPLGQSHWVALVRLAHFGVDTTRPAAPRTKAGRFDRSVLADAAGPPEPSLAVGFAWEEREPFAVRLLLPGRLAGLDDDRGATLREPLRLLLDRHRPAGVDVRVGYADPRWTLGVGITREGEEEALGTALVGTELWPDGTPQIA